MPKATAAATVLVIIALLVGASGTYLTFSVQDSVGRVRSEALGISDRLTQLYEALGVGGADEAKVLADARKEGKVVVYGTIDGDIMQAAIDLFERLFPVKVEYWRASSSGVFDRVLTEVKAGNPRFDVVVMSPFLLNAVKKEGAFQKYAAPEAAAYPKELQFDPDGFVSPSFVLRPIGIVYNTKLLKAEDAPKSLQDLLDPKWKGKIVIPDPAQHATTVDWLFSLRNSFPSEAAWQSWIKGLAKNEPRLVKSFIPAVETVIKGEKPLAITYIRYLVVYPKAPLDYARVTDALGNVNSLALAGKPAHPTAAKLFINFMLSKRALEALAAAGENVSLPGIYPPIKDIAKVRTSAVTELTEEERSRWAETFHNWLTGS